jgi:sterol 3beta-glucosyltransferase
MPLSLITRKELGHVQVKNKTKDASAVGRVDSNGQVDVKFHSNPKQLTEYFERFEHAFQQRPNKSPARDHKFADEEKPAPTPRLNIAIHIVGSRGDVQPFIPIAQLLIGKYGHRVRIGTHPNFKDFVESNGIEFFSIGGDPEALMAYMVKNPGLLPSRESLKAGDVGKRKREMAEIIDGVWRSCIEAGDGMGERVRAANVASAKDLFIADAIIANPPSMAHIHCAEKLNVPLHMVFTMPWSPTAKFHHPLAAMNYGEADHSTANYLSFMMMELLTWEG